MLTGGFRWLAATVAAVALGEAVALLMGTRAKGGERNPWATPTNRAFLAADVVSGTAVIWLTLTAPGSRVPPWLWAWMAFFVLTHAVRLGQCLLRRPNAFLANRQLLAVDIAKLAGMALVVVAALASARV